MATGQEYLQAVVLTVYLVTLVIPIAGLTFVAARRERQAVKAERAALQKTLMVARRGRRF
jgi:hypothetical protein